MSKKYMFINLFSQLVAFGVSFIISFFITPKIIGAVGKETYGFWGLANNFAGYVTVITAALNALAGRFVTISIHRNNVQEANEYLDGNYAAFGKITKGLEVIDKIAKSETTTNEMGMADVPVKPIVIKTIRMSR